MEIILLRHGKPKVELKGFLHARELKQLVVDYANSGIQDSPIEKLKSSFNNHFVVCSDLPRSIESANKLNFKSTTVSDALFREIDIPHFDKSIIKLPVTIWLILLRVMWLFGFSKNGESFSQAKKRSKQGAAKLIVLAQKKEKILVVGHGLMNWLIAKQLQHKGWKSSGVKANKYWAYTSYTFNG